MTLVIGLLVLGLSVLLGAHNIKKAIMDFKEKHYYLFGLDVMLTCMWAACMVAYFIKN